jgi:hypothetical protein
MTSLRDQNANKITDAEDDIQEDDPMSELEEDGDDDDSRHRSQDPVDVRYIFNWLYEHYIIKDTTGCSCQD